MARLDSHLDSSQGMTMVYRETFEKDAGVWSCGKAAPDGDWHRNILRERGKAEPLAWSPAGGRHGGGFASSQSPWYFDDNHGEFMWLYLAFFINRSELAGLDGRDLRNARIDLSMRGHKFDARGTELFFWIQGYACEDLPTRRFALNWALTSQPITRALLDGHWHDEAVHLVPDERQWRFMGHLNGGLARKIRVLQSLTFGEGTLDAILGGTHINFGFLLCGVDQNDPPHGRIDLQEVAIFTPSSARTSQ